MEEKKITTRGKDIQSERQLQHLTKTCTDELQTDNVCVNGLCQENTVCQTFLFGSKSQSINLSTAVILANKRKPFNPSSTRISPSCKGLLLKVGNDLISENKYKEEKECDKSLFEPILPINSNNYKKQRQDYIREFATLMNKKFKLQNPSARVKDKSLIDPNASKMHSRPRWPYNLWIRHNYYSHFDPDVFLSVYDPYVNPHESSILYKFESDFVLKRILEVDLTTIDTKLINQIMKEALDSIPKIQTNEFRQVVQDVWNIVHKTCCELERKHKIFKNFKIVEMGSMAEGTKVGSPNEFDFMIELPILDEVLHAEMAGTFLDRKDNEIRHIIIDKEEFFDDFEDLFATRNKKSCDRKQKYHDRNFLQSLWYLIQNEIIVTMKTLTPPSWKWLDTAPSFMLKPALTQTLLWQGYEYKKMFVHIDICLCFKPSHFESSVAWNQLVLDKTRPGLTNHNATQKQFLKPVLLMLISDGTARWTYALQEKQIWSLYSEEDGRKLTYRCLKYAILNYMILKYNEAQFRLDPIVPSYWVKTILYYLMVVYHEDQQWTADKMIIRFLEVLLLLKKCFIEGVLSSYFVPRNLLMRVIEEEELEKIKKIFCSFIDWISSREASKADSEKTVTKITQNNKIELENGLLHSVIEFCYFYGYNEFSSRIFEAIHLFVNLYASDNISLEGTCMKLFFKNKLIDINDQIHNQFGEDIRYFN